MKCFYLVHTLLYYEVILLTIHMSINPSNEQTNKKQNNIEGSLHWNYYYYSYLILYS